MAYQTLVCPKLRYAPSVWSSWQSYLTNHLEALQNWELSFIYSDSSFYTSITELQTRTDIPMLFQCGIISHLVLFHKLYDQNLFLKRNFPIYSFFLVMIIPVRLPLFFGSANYFCNSTLPLARSAN